MKEVFEKQMDDKVYFFSSSSPSIILNLFTWKELHLMIYLFWEEYWKYYYKSSKKKWRFQSDKD